MLRTLIGLQGTGKGSKGKDGLLSQDETDNISLRMRNKLDLSTEDFLTDPLHVGVLMKPKSLPDHYKIPIPSLGDFLREFRMLRLQI